MAKIGDVIQSADWKKEKHAPVIECPDSVKAGEFFDITLSVGKEIPHPNTTEHHIVWISLYFYPQGSKFAHLVGKYEFSSHGAAATGPNTGPVYTNPKVVSSLSLATSGTLFAVSYCNIHGLWENSKEISVS